MPRRDTGLTLGEMVTALVITSVIGLAVGGVSIALSRAHEQSEEYYRYLQSGRVASSRLEALLRQSQLVTAADQGALVLWMGDTNGDGGISIAELQRVYFDSSTGQLFQRTVEVPSSVKGWLKKLVDPSVTLSSVTQATVASDVLGWRAYDIQRVLATDVKAFVVRPDAPAPLAKFVSFRIDIGGQDKSVTIVGGGAVRAEKTGWVGMSDGQYVLQPPQ